MCKKILSLYVNILTNIFSIRSKILLKYLYDLKFLDITRKFPRTFRETVKNYLADFVRLGGGCTVPFR